MSRLPRDKRNQIIAVVLCTAVVLAGVYYGLIQAQLNALAEQGRQATELKDKVAKADKLIKLAEKVRSDLAETEQRLGEIESGMASGDKYSWVITTLNKFRAAYNVEISEFSREQEIDVGLLPQFPYRAAQFSVRGSAYFHDLGRFLCDFENTYPYMRCQALDLEHTSGLTGENREKLAFKLDIVALVKPTAAPAPAPPATK